MHLHRGLGDADLVGNLFAQTAARHLNHNLALPWAERGEPLSKGGQILVIFPPGTIARETDLNGVEEILIAERFGQELDGAPFHGLHGHRYVAVSRDEDDRDFPVCRNELALKIEAALVWHSDVEHEAGGTIRRIGLEELGNGRK